MRTWKLVVGRWLEFRTSVANIRLPRLPRLASVYASSERRRECGSRRGVALWGSHNRSGTATSAGYREYPSIKPLSFVTSPVSPWIGCSVGSRVRTLRTAPWGRTGWSAWLMAQPETGVLLACWSVIFERSGMRNRIVVEERAGAVPHDDECEEAEQREHWRAPLIQCGRPHLEPPSEAGGLN